MPADHHSTEALESDACYLAMKTHDARFDGSFFTAVTSTGIYCRPVCRVKLPRRENCRFFRHAAQAEAAGFRPCLRCRPELAPRASGAASWSTEDASRILAQQAARLLDALARVGHRVAVVLEHAPGTLMEALALLGQAQARGSAAQQAHAQRALQPRDQLADGRLRGAERAGRAREAAQFDAVHEGFKSAQGVHDVFGYGMAWMPFCSLPIWMSMNESGGLASTFIRKTPCPHPLSPRPCAMAPSHSH